MTSTQDGANQAEHTPRPTDPSDADPSEVTSPGGQVEELMEMAERSGATTDPADSAIGEAQLDRHPKDR